MFKKTLSIVLALTMVFSLVSLTGCGSGDDKKTDATQSSVASKDTQAEKTPIAEKVTIRILTRWSTTASRDVAFKNRIAKFMEENPNITVEDESVNDENTFNNKFKTAVATGNVQEIWMNYGGEPFKQYAQNNVAMDLEPIINEDKAWSEKFLPLFDTWRYSDVQGTYGIPSEFYALGIYYNKDLFKKINAEIPKTLEEFAEVSKKFLEIGITPMMMGEKDNFRGGHLLSVLSMKKFGFQKSLDLASRKAKWDDPDMISLLSLMKDWQDIGIFGKNIVTLDGNLATQAFVTEKSAMKFDGTWFLEEIAKSPIAGKVGVMPIPGFSDKPEFKDTWFGGAGGFSVSAAITGAKKDATIKLLKYMASSEAFTYYQEESKGGLYPAKTNGDPSKLDPVTIDFSKALEVASDMKGEITQYDSLPQLMDKSRNEIQGMFAGNSPEKTAKAIQAEIDKSSK